VNALVLFARKRRRLTATERFVGDRMMLQAERRTAFCVWALDVLTHVFRGEFDDANTLAAMGPPQIRMRDSINVAYGRLRHRGALDTRLIADRAFVTIQSMTESIARAVEEIARAVAVPRAA
jgi:hypothetical protein